MKSLLHRVFAWKNIKSIFTRGYEVVAADIADLDSEIGIKLNRFFYTVDEQGSTTLVTDKNQQVKNEYYFDAFGYILESREEIHNRITYTGQQFDGITGQYYLRARYYNPAIGRFTQEDIYRGDGLNLYAYCGDNPIRYYDTTGYKCDSKQSAFGKIADQDVKHYNDYWDNVAASEGRLPDYNKAIHKNDVLGDYYQVKLKYESGVKWGDEVLDMKNNDFNLKASRLNELSDSNSLYKTKPDRDPNVTKSYKKEMRKAIKEAYKDDKVKRDRMMENLDNIDPDHIWELHLGGLDEFENLKMIDSFTNRRIGQNLGTQMRNVPEGARIKIVVER